MKRAPATTFAAALALASGVALGVPGGKDPLGDLAATPAEPAPAHGPLIPPPTTPFEVEAAVKQYTEEERRVEAELAKIEEELAVIDERVIARGKAYFKQVRAGLLPAGGGFDELVDHAARVERTRLALMRDIEQQKTLRARRTALSERLTRVKVERAPLEMQRVAIQKAKNVMRMADDRRAAFDRAFESSRPPSDYVAIYGADLGPSDGGSGEAFAASFGRLPLPLAGRAEITKIAGSAQGGPALELRAPAGATARSVAAGRVVFADKHDSETVTVVLDHGERHFTLYGNLERSEVKLGENVPSNTTLGIVATRGLDGSVLYFEIRKNGQPVEPAPWFGL